jgi:mannose-6-phosphate isomerase
MKKKIEKRPWGGFEQFTLNEISTVKILTLRPQQRFSLQKHSSRSEFWRFLDNPAKVTIGKKTFRVKKGDEIKIPSGSLHRIQALSKPVSVLEISLGKFKEKDIKRLDDDYGRD